MTWTRLEFAALTVTYLYVCYKAAALKSHYTARAWRLLAAGFFLPGMLSLSRVFQEWLPWWADNDHTRRLWTFCSLVLVLFSLREFTKDFDSLRHVNTPPAADRASGQQSTKFWETLIRKIVREELDRK